MPRGVPRKGHGCVGRGTHFAGVALRRSTLQIIELVPRKVSQGGSLLYELRHAGSALVGVLARPYRERKTQTEPIAVRGTENELLPLVFRTRIYGLGRRIRFRRKSRHRARYNESLRDESSVVQSKIRRPGKLRKRSQADLTDGMVEAFYGRAILLVVGVR